MAMLESLRDEQDEVAPWISMTDVLVLSTVLLIAVTFCTTRYAQQQHAAVVELKGRLSVLLPLQETEDLIAEIGRKRQENDNLIAEVKRLKDRIDISERERNDYLNRWNLARKEVERLEAELVAANKDKESKDRQRDDLLNQLRLAEKEVKDLKAELATAENSRKEMKARLTKVEQALENSRDTLASTERELLRLKQLLANSDQAVMKLTAARDDLKKLLADANSELKKEQHRITELEANQIRISQELAAVRQTAIRFFLQATWQAFKKDLELAELRQRYAKLERDNVRLNGQISGFEAETRIAVIRERHVRQELLGLQGRLNKLNRVVVIIDRSGSMTFPPGNGHKSGVKLVDQVGLKRWDYVQNILHQWLNLLPFSEVALVVFSDEPEHFPALTEAGPTFLRVRDINGMEIKEGREKLSEYLKSLEPNGGTNTLGALRAAFKLTSADAIILFTDGVPTVTPLNGDPRNLHQQVLDEVDAYVKTKSAVPINVVGIGDYFANVEGSDIRLAGGTNIVINLGQFLQDIAEKSGGRFIGK